jgi:hypothetical protein
MADSNFMDYISPYLPGGNGTMEQAAALPLIGSAIKQWGDADTFRQSGQNAANISNPFGSQRAQYAQKLSDAYSNPQAVLDSPEFQAINNHQMNTIANHNGAAGYLGAGKNDTDLGRYLASANAEQLGSYRKDLANLAGAQFDPANAGRFLMEGDRNAINSQNGALASLATVYGNATRGPSGTTPAGSNPAITAASKLVTDIFSKGGTPSSADVAKLVASGQQFLKLPDGTTIDLHAYLRSGGDNPADPYPTSPDDPRLGGRDDRGYLPGEPGYDVGGSTMPVPPPDDGSVDPYAGYPAPENPYGDYSGGWVPDDVYFTN